MSKTIFETIKSEHREVEEMLEKLGSSEMATAKKREILENLKTEIRSHMRAEEDVLYSRVRNQPGSNEEADHGKKEHYQIQGILKRMETVEINSDLWEKYLKDLKDSVEHHHEDEEKELFSDAKEQISSTDATRLNNLFIQRKKQYSGEAENPIRNTA